MDGFGFASLLTFQVFNYTLLMTICEEKILKWGIFGEEISWCTVKRLGFQTLLPLMASAAVAAFAGRTDNLFFCT